MTISRLEPVPLRELCRPEEQDFSAWLHDNLQVLGDVLQMQLSEPRKEVAVGSFTVDLVAEEETLGRVIIENQLAATDHDHLGKLLTYLTSLEVKAAVWITPQPRPEHTRAIAWLNETTPDDVAFYLVQVAAYRIGESAPAPLFKVIRGRAPDERRASRIRSTQRLGGLSVGESEWPRIRDPLIDALRRLVDALKPHVRRLVLNNRLQRPTCCAARRRTGALGRRRCVELL